MSAVTTIDRETLRGLLAEGHHDVDAAFDLIDRWVARGDTALVYENHDLGSSGAGQVIVVSYGGHEAQIEHMLYDAPPEMLPDIGGLIGWRYRLISLYDGSEVDPFENIVNAFMEQGWATDE